MKIKFVLADRADYEFARELSCVTGWRSAS